MKVLTQIMPEYNSKINPTLKQIMKERKKVYNFKKILC